MPVLAVNETDVHQMIDGFGGAITDSVAQVFASLNSTVQNEVLEAIWGASGQQYNLVSFLRILVSIFE